MTPLRFGLLLLAVVVAGIAIAGCSSLERRLLFFPSHRPPDGALAEWRVAGEVVGCARPVEHPANVWLMLHGNGGQAEDRAYALPSFSDRDAVFILEYPGYGLRAGTPSRTAIDRAALEGYRALRAAYPHTPVCVVGESLGSGPASTLAALEPPPDKFVLIVPFDRLASVARDHFPAPVVSVLLHDDWDNVAALRGYRGPIDLFGAADDTVIPVRHARALAAALPDARLTVIHGGHNDWSRFGEVRIRRP